MFNRVKTICVLGVGLLAMLLGTTAEAHYTYVRGKYYYHSVGCDATIGSLPVHPDPLEVKCQVDATRVELLCPGNVPEILNFEISPLRLVADVQIPPGQTQVEVLVDDSPLLMSCSGSQPSFNALVRNMISMVTISKCASLVGHPCLVRLVTGTAIAQCELPAQFNFDNYPENLPPDGTQYTCTDPIKVHVY